MPKTDLSRNAFVRLARWGDQGALQKRIAALTAGWLAILAKPPLAPRRGLTAKELGLGVLVLLALFVGLPPVLALMQPLFRALGQLGGFELAFIGFMAINLWRYAVGRKLLVAVRAELLSTDADAKVTLE